MASRLPTRARHLSATRIAVRSPLPPPSPLLQSHLLQQHPPSQPKPAAAGTTTAIRHVSTTAPRPWLLSALPNLVPGANSGPPPPKTVRARRLLPYTPAQVYALIADVDSYKHFLPHCAHSRVTKWTTPPKHPPAQAAATTTTTPTRYPALADLTVGWGPFTQTYTSRVYCVPGEVVEAVSGSADTSIPREVLRSVGYELGEECGGGRPPRMEGIFESLVTRWTVKPAGVGHGGGGPAARGRGEGPASCWTEVTLSVTFQFANPALGFAVGQVADEKVDEMAEAFEGRARRLYGR
ncbi:hypothetical protein MYCTH_2300663 [Thermothelomyces thermophilus ATCC 42464]|uniref:Coenzyme Q-binding protein COQ10 START domain-containing protein n=1 Tax=Thermothelomyces thermophilus (strain ATCC 42464 / BCRC 31852 / DSM 1799) TaxID=573729 RepID=G2Q7W1_THET4|nr:uncharacterized protein MYCTH_2300663 [Thermothelomyces thermophilus ATCC 42464]AEO56118.1 hypothetical protein MYCTH_2300663 [Thermothelomyces thermophilus ATCC 42464]